MNLQIPNQLVQQKQSGLQVSQLFSQKSHLFFDFCLRHILPEQPCVPTCPAPNPGAQGTLGRQGDTCSSTAATWGEPWVRATGHGGPAFVPPYRGAPRLPTHHRHKGVVPTFDKITGVSRGGSEGRLGGVRAQGLQSPPGAPSCCGGSFEGVRRACHTTRGPPLLLSVWPDCAPAPHKSVPRMCPCCS